MRGLIEICEQQIQNANAAMDKMKSIGGYYNAHIAAMFTAFEKTAQDRGNRILEVVGQMAHLIIMRKLLAPDAQVAIKCARDTLSSKWPEIELLTQNECMA